MRFLLDTHTLIWALGDVLRIRESTRERIRDPANRVFVSAASAWEIAIKAKIGALRAPADLEDQLAAKAFSELPITIGHTLCAGALPLHHRDPFDRLLVAQAQLEGLTIVTRDERIARYDVPILAA